MCLFVGLGKITDCKGGFCLNTNSPYHSNALFINNTDWFMPATGQSLSSFCLVFLDNPSIYLSDTDLNGLVLDTHAAVTHPLSVDQLLQAQTCSNIMGCRCS